MKPITHNAITLHAEANKSDPFASRRMALHLKQGIENPREVCKDAERVIAARRAVLQAAYDAWMKSDERKALVARLTAPRTELKMAA